MHRILIYSAGINRPSGFKTVIRNLFEPSIDEYEFAIATEVSESFLVHKRGILQLNFSSPEVLRDFIDWWKPSAVMVFGCYVQLYYWFKYNIPLPIIPLFHIERIRMAKWIYSFFDHVWFTIVPSQFTKRVFRRECEVITWGVDHKIFFPIERSQGTSFTFGSGSCLGFM